MKLSISACLSALTVSGLSAGIDLSNVRHHFSKLVDGVKVPGESPFEFCDADRQGELLGVKNITINPNPVKAGQKTTVTTTLNVEKTINKGAYVKIVVKYGLIRLISTTADLCEQAYEYSGVTCPLKAGKHEISFDVDMPETVPPGTYSVFGDAYSDDDEPITCLKAVVRIPPSALFGAEL